MPDSERGDFDERSIKFIDEAFPFGRSAEGMLAADTVYQAVERFSDDPNQAIRQIAGVWVSLNNMNIENPGDIRTRLWNLAGGTETALLKVMNACSTEEDRLRLSFNRRWKQSDR